MMTKELIPTICRVIYN